MFMKDWIFLTLELFGSKGPLSDTCTEPHNSKKIFQYLQKRKWAQEEVQ